MTTVALLQDPTGKGGTATAVYWYRSWMQRHDPTYIEFFLAEHGRSGLRRLRDRSAEGPEIPRILPRLHVPQYWCGARWLRRSNRASGRDVHVVGASIAHGTLLPGRKAVVWLATLYDDERRGSMSGRSTSRRLLYAATLRSLSRLERQVLGDADRVMAMSHHTAGLIVDRGLAPASAVTVVPVPVDTDVLQPPTDGTYRRGVLFVGRAHDPRKGFARLVALVHASREVRQRGVTVISPGVVPPLPEGMTWCGRVADLREAYQRHELLVLPSIQEGLGIVAFEAMACGTPVVAWRCGGPDRFISESGGGVLVNDAAELKRVVCALLSDSELRYELGLAGRRYVEQRFSAQSFLGDPCLFTPE